MSRLKQLSICGIRNFDDQEQPRIRFTRPLTLILGPNGTGKTTIIEALKFATTGDFPPGSDKGKAFIHDCNTGASRVVRGFVKAELVSARGCIYTICRTIECMHSHTTSRFKTLDSTLSRREKGSTKPVSVTSRCLNVNEELISVMGVSKAILNYVIFCHQEEFSWPLDDGKKLKERFDEIFDSVRLNKLLESYIKRIKALEQTAKVLQVQKNALQNIVSEVEDKEKKRDDTKKRLEDTTNEIKAMDNELKSIVEKIQKYEEMHTKYKAIVTERDKKKLEYDVNKQQSKSIQENIREIFSGTMTELAARLELYDDNLSKKISEISELEKELQQIASNEVKVTNMITERKITVGTLNQKVQDQEKKIILRNKTLNEALSAWDIKTLVDADTSDIEIAGLVKEFENKIENLKRIAEEKRQKRNRKEEELQKEIDVLRSERSKIESEMNIKDNDVTETRNEMNRIRDEIAEIGVATNKLNSVELQLQEANKNIDDLSQSLDVTTIKEEINDEMSTRDALEVELSAVNDEIETLHKHATLQAEIALHKSAQQTKEKEIECFIKKHEDRIKMLLDVKEVPHTKLKDQLDAVQQKLVDQIKTMTRELQSEEQKLVTLQTTLKYNEEELQKKLSELKSNKQKISPICDYKEFDEALLLQSKKVKDLQDKRGMYAHQSAAYKEYMKKLKTQDPCCPLCHRNFDESYKVDALIEEMENEIKNQPDTLKNCETDLKVQQKKYDTMLQLKPIVEKISQLEDIEIPILEETLEDTKNKLTKHKIIIQEKERLKTTPEQNLKDSKNLFEDVMLWDRLIDEMKNLQQKICNIEELVAETATNTRTISEAQAHRDTLNTSLKKSRDRSQYLQTQLNTFNETLQRVREERNILFEEQLKIQSDMQKLKQLKEKQTELSSRRVTLVELVQNLRDRLLSADNKLEAAVGQLDTLKKENWQEEEADRKAVIEGGRKLFELNKIQNEVNAFDRSNVSKTLAKLELEIKNYEEVISRNNTEKNNLETTIQELKDEINQQETRKRDLSDNLTLRKLQATLQDLQQQWQALNEQLESVDYNRMIEKAQKYKSNEDNLLRKKNIAEGKKEELERTLIQYGAELTRGTYRNARQNYMDKSIELTLQKEATDDLKKYSKVLDKAIIKYHKERMATVNTIMNKLWKAIYIGNDTSSIEIRTNETEGVAHIRRSYNYKLVQIKNGKEMDMRGRCSAGQKVLASIIIRLALAETFCKHCGVLALDEPTTNLDEGNADSLALALDKIVKLRSQYQKNFQLVVISHDEKFMLNLAHLNNNAGYHELYRKNNGLSSIRFRKIELDEAEITASNEIVLSDDENETTDSTLQKEPKKKRTTSEDKNTDNDKYNPPKKKRFAFT